MEPDLRHVRLEREESWAVLTIDRPEARNALAPRTMEEFGRAIDTVARDVAGRRVRALVLTGAGSQVFVAGGDLKALRALASPDEGKAMGRRMGAALERMGRLDVPVVCVLNGSAYGGGCEVMLAADYRIAGDHVRICFRQTAMGLMPGWGGGVRLVRAVGAPHAVRLLAAAEEIDAAEALRLGLVQRVVSAGSEMDEARSLCRKIASNSFAGVASSLRAVRRAGDESLSDAIGHENQLFWRLWGGADHEEAVRAFFEKRSPRFGRQIAGEASCDSRSCGASGSVEPPDRDREVKPENRKPELP